MARGMDVDYRTTAPSADGTYSPRICPEINEKLTMFCKLFNRNKTEVTNQLLSQAIDNELKAFEEWKASKEV